MTQTWIVILLLVTSADSKPVEMERQHLYNYTLEMCDKAGASATMHDERLTYACIPFSPHFNATQLEIIK